MKTFNECPVFVWSFFCFLFFFYFHLRSQLRPWPLLFLLHLLSFFLSHMKWRLGNYSQEKEKPKCQPQGAGSLAAVKLMTGVLTLV